MLKIFISYAREDARDLAQRLTQDLRALGYNVWLDVSAIPGGADWERDIENAIESSELMLALLSHGSYASDICRSEQSRAIRKGKRIIPLLVQPDAERPLQMENRNYLDFSDDSQYAPMFRDLISDITAGQAFKLPEPRPGSAGGGTNEAFHGKRSTQVMSPFTAAEKRDARAFRRYIKDLRDEAWLGARYWWAYFLFYYADMQDVVDTLQHGALLSRAGRAGKQPAGNTPQRRQKLDKWDHFVRLNFRPRTPDLFLAEGARPVERQRVGAYVPAPVYLLFDMEAVLCQPETRFTDGDPEVTSKTYKTATAFRDLPFEMIYHDSWVSRDERDEVMRSRRAQVLAEERLGLESLQFIWCRSQAEYDLLRALLPPEVWKQWRDKITARADFNLFNRKWVYVEDAALAADHIRLRFNPAEIHADAGPFMAKAEVRAGGGGAEWVHSWQTGAFVVNGDLVLSLAHLRPAERYSVRFWLNGDLAYTGEWHGDSVLL